MDPDVKPTVHHVVLWAVYDWTSPDFCVYLYEWLHKWKTKEKNYFYIASSSIKFIFWACEE